MKLFLYELLKILKNRAFIILVSAMLCLHVCSYYLSIHFTPTWSEKFLNYHFQEKVEIIYEEYDKNPEYILEIYNLNNTKMQEELDKLQQAANEGIAYNIASAPAVYFKDMTLASESFPFSIFATSLTYSEEYNKKIEEIISSAQRYLKNMEKAGGEPNKFIYDQQIKSIEKYKDIAHLDIPVIYSDGMESFFTYGYVNLFLLLAVLLVCSEIFAVDNGMMSVMIRSSVKGRFPIFAAKICVSIVLNVALTFLFYITTLFSVFGKFGIPNLLAPLHSIPLFEICPYHLTILGGIVVVFALKCLIILAFSSFVMVFSTLRNQLITYLSGVVFIAINYLLSVVRYTDMLNPFKIYNLYSIANPYMLIDKYSLLNVFSNAVPALSVVCIILSVIIVVCFCVSAIVYLKNTTITFRLPRLKIKLFDKKLFNLNIKSLINWEAYKIFIDKKMALFIVLMIIVSVVFSVDTYQTPDSPIMIKYKEVITNLEGPVTAEKLNWINEEIGRLNQSVASRTLLKNQYDADEISSEEYLEQLRLTNIAEMDLVHMQQISEQANYLLTLGDDAVFLYDYGWKNLLLRDRNIFFFICIILVFAGIFSDEFSSGFAPLLRTTVFGRRKVTVRKYAITAVSSFILFMIFESIDLITIYRNYGLPKLSAPLACLINFEGTDISVSIIEGYIIHVVACLVISVFAAMAVSVLSYLTKNKTATITLSALLCAGLYLI